MGYSRLMLFIISWLQMESMTSSIPEFPNPQVEWRMCGRPKPSFVCDPDFVLELGQAERLDQLCQEFMRSSACPCPRCKDKEEGIAIGVLVKSNISQSALSKYRTADEVAEMLRRLWGFSSCDGDIVIVLLAQNNMSGYSTGPPVKTYLTDETANQILNDCRIHFDSGWYYQGLESVVNSFVDVILKQQKESENAYTNLLIGLGIGFGVLFIVSVSAFFITRRNAKKRRKKSCSNIYESVPSKTKVSRRKSSFSHEEHLEKLRQLNTSSSDSEEEEETSNVNHHTHLHQKVSNKFNRQLSDVPEELSCEESEKLSVSVSSSLRKSSLTANGSLPITEL